MSKRRCCCCVMSYGCSAARSTGYTWNRADRAIIAAVVRLLRGSERGSLLVKPETVLGWHRELVRRK